MKKRVLPVMRKTILDAWCVASGKILLNAIEKGHLKQHVRGTAKGNENNEGHQVAHTYEG